MTQMGGVSTADVAAERAKQLELALKHDLAMQQRLDRVADPLLRSAVAFCAAAARPRTGLRLGNVAQYRAEWGPAARTLGYSDTLQAFYVAPGSAAARAGIETGDRVLRVGTRAIPTGPNASPTAVSVIDDAARRREPVTLTVQRAGQAERAITLTPEAACAYDAVIERSGALNAYADGQRIVVTTAMLRFAADDDELALVLAHEIAHNAMRHLDAARTNTVLGTLFGAVVDVAAAAGGYNTQGQFMKAGAQVGAQAFSQDFEREADYVALYILARAEKPITGAADFWRRMAVENPGSIVFATTHPTSAERFVRLEQWRREIEVKVASGELVLPEMRNVKGRSDARTIAVPKVEVALTPGAAPSAPRAPHAAQPSAATPVATTPSVRPGAAEAVTPARSDGASLAGPTSATRGVSAAEAAAAATGTATFADLENDKRFARATFRVANSDTARSSAAAHYARGGRHMQRKEWERAAESLRQALQLDGSVAAYHAALGEVMWAMGRLDDAQASYSAAVLIDLDNANYRETLKTIRRHRGQ